jgi:hypothetical protein
MLLGFMGLCRSKTTEQLRGKAPGELGKLMGLDRVPEVRCLRKNSMPLPRFPLDLLILRPRKQSCSRGRVGG